jgi:hypothetical protein
MSNKITNKSSLRTGKIHDRDFAELLLKKPESRTPLLSAVISISKLFLLSKDYYIAEFNGLPLLSNTPHGIVPVYTHVTRKKSAASPSKINALNYDAWFKLCCSIADRFNDGDLKNVRDLVVLFDVVSKALEPHLKAFEDRVGFRVSELNLGSLKRGARSGFYGTAKVYMTVGPDFLNAQVRSEQENLVKLGWSHASDQTLAA